MKKNKYITKRFKYTTPQNKYTTSNFNYTKSIPKNPLNEWEVIKCERRIRRLLNKRYDYLENFVGAGKQNTYYFDQQLKVAEQQLKNALR
jgi:hypothetical protein